MKKVVEVTNNSGGSKEMKTIFPKICLIIFLTLFIIIEVKCQGILHPEGSNRMIFSDTSSMEGFLVIYEDNISLIPQLNNQSILYAKRKLKKMIHKNSYRIIDTSDLRYFWFLFEGNGLTQCESNKINERYNYNQGKLIFNKYYVIENITENIIKLRIPQEYLTSQYSPIKNYEDLPHEEGYYVIYSFQICK